VENLQKSVVFGTIIRDFIFFLTYMFSWQSIGLLVGGLGLFLFAMFIFEEGISSLVNNNFKRFFEKATNSKLKSILTGIFTTTVLQSSAMVSLIVLAFVGTGVLELTQAIAVIIGTNI
jgi:phosphate:Na+ symporter